MIIDRETAELYAKFLTQSEHPYGALRTMLGTQRLQRIDNGIRFDLHGSAHRTPSCELVYDDGLDLFNLRFCRGGKEIKSFNGLFCDQLKEVFEGYTGLTLTMPRIFGLDQARKSDPPSESSEMSM